jgi:hypothetical protein
VISGTEGRTRVAAMQGRKDSGGQTDGWGGSGIYLPVCFVLCQGVRTSGKQALHTRGVPQVFSRLLVRSFERLFGYCND